MTARQAADLAMCGGAWQHREEVEQFMSWLMTRGAPEGVIEIGTLHGGMTLMFARVCIGRVYTIDLPDGRFGGADHGYDMMRCLARSDRLVRESIDVLPIVGDSHSRSVEEMLAQDLGGRSVGLLFIDGDHTYAGVSDDYVRYRKYVRSGGVVAFHDVNDTEFHRAAGCEVPRLWGEIEGEKHVFSVGADWGGIGAMVVP